VKKNAASYAKQYVSLFLSNVARDPWLRVCV